MASFPMIINGQKVMTRETIGVINPATGEHFAQVPIGTLRHVDDAVVAAGVTSGASLAVLRRFSQMADVNPEPRTVDEQVDRSIRGEPAEPNAIELLEPSGQRGVIRNRKI